MNTLSSPFILSKEVSRARRTNGAIVALESTVITHGLPQPQNLELAGEMENIVRKHGATPATIAILDGRIHIGLTSGELERLAGEKLVRKVSRRDFAAGILKKECGGTTVAGTMFAAQKAGIKIFATGGIGGVHNISSLDISTDLQALADTPMIVVCAGAKAILDLPATLEYLETMSVPVVGYQTDEFPAFYSRRSGLPVGVRLDTVDEIARYAQVHWELGMKSAVLVCQPLPENEEIPSEMILEHIQRAQDEALEKGIRGQTLTPFLLDRMATLSKGEALRANLALLQHNAALAAEAACAWVGLEKGRSL